MPNYVLCDTCVIIDFMNERSNIVNELQNRNVTLFINSIIEMELLQGARNKNELRAIEKKLCSFRCLLTIVKILDFLMLIRV